MLMRRGRARLSPAPNSHDRAGDFRCFRVIGCVISRHALSETMPWINQSNYPHATHEQRVAAIVTANIATLSLRRWLRRRQQGRKEEKERKRDRKLFINKNTAFCAANIRDSAPSDIFIPFFFLYKQ